MPSDCDITVIVPVYNTMPELRRCLDSLVRQDMGELRYEIVAVDDGSTDGSGELLDTYAAEHPQLRVIHQENSGWPGQPRNVGITSSTGRYVFFADADDELGKESLRRQVEFADQHGCDVVVPMLLDSPGAPPHGAIWANPAVDADRALLFKTLSPQKLFRRAFLAEHHLRFPEGVVPLEDGIMVSRAYLLAKRVSVLADYEYYYKRPRANGGNISLQGKAAAPFIDSVSEIIETVREHAEDTETADRIIGDLYRRKALKYLLAHRFVRYKPAVRKAWVDAVGELARTRIPTALEERLSADARLRSAAARTGDAAVVKALAEAVNSGGVAAQLRMGRVTAVLPGTSSSETVDVTGGVRARARLVFARSKRDGFRLVIDIASPPFIISGAQWELVLRKRERDGTADAVVPLRRARGSSTVEHSQATGFVPAAELGSTDKTRWDAFVRLRTSTASEALPESRLAPQVSEPSAILPSAVSTSSWRVEPYLTIHGNCSFVTGPPKPQTARVTNTVEQSRRWLRWQGRKLTGGVATGRQAQKVLDTLPNPAADLVRSGLVRVRQAASVRERLLDGLAPLGMYVRGVGAGTVAVSRNPGLHVANVDENTVLLTHDKPTAPDVFETHKALYKRMVTEHVVDMLHTYRVNCVLDVGANKGQYARELRKAGYEGHIVSFEPVPETFEYIQRRAAKDPKWIVQNCALGRADGTMPMNVVAGTMSSLLAPSEYGDRRYKRFNRMTTIDVPVRRLEQVLDEVIPGDIRTPRLYLKLDTQGYDLEVFAGLGERASEIVSMQSEVALLRIYEGMPRLPEAVEIYEAAGFEITGMFPVTRERDTGRVLEFDCVLARACALHSQE